MINIRTQNRVPDLSATSKTLVDHALEGQDAKDLVEAILDSTVNFHKLCSLRAQVKAECPELNSMQAIRELVAKRAECEELFKSAPPGYKLRVRTTIELEIDGDAVDQTA